MKKSVGVTIAAIFVGVVALCALLWVLAQAGNLQVLNPKGSIAEAQRDLMVVATILMLTIVLPVFFLTFFIAWRYREGNTKARYTPELHGSKKAELLWWSLPLVIVLILSMLIWKSSHELDPYRPLESDVAPVRIQVVALQWKWLFLYPDQNIATVNYIKVPTNTPINFEITADAPMNSFWIPQLGGQVYAMSGMTTKLHLSATEPGVYAGSSANLSGEGFSGMKFNTEAVSREEFDSWVTSSDGESADLDNEKYIELAKATMNNPRTTYGSFMPGLYDTIVMKYMAHGSSDKGHHGH